MEKDPCFYSPYPRISGIEFTSAQQEKDGNGLLTKLFHFFQCNKSHSTAFFADNLLTFGKTLGFLKEPKFIQVANAIPEENTMMRALSWRTHTICWAGYNGLKVEGDFVELGCYKGDSAQFMCDYLDFNKSGKKFYLYDVFDNPPDTHTMPEHSSDLYEMVCTKFKSYPNVVLTKGLVPATLHQTSPEKIAFMHVDMNNARAEVLALELLFDRVVPGGMIVFDDYGWAGYKEQYNAEYLFMAKRGYKILELPTGQGLVVKR